MALGLSFGSSKEKSSTNSTGTKNENVIGSEVSNQTGSTTTAGQTVGQQNQTTQANSTSQGTSTTDQVGSSQQLGTSNQSNLQTTNLFSDPILNQLGSFLSQALGGKDPNNADAVIAPMGAFDPESFVNQSVQAAAGKSNASLVSGINGIFDALGGKNNTMAALLGNQLQTDNSAMLAGVEADATAAAQGIVGQRAQTQLAAQGQGNDFIGQILNALKGGTQTTSGVAQTQTAGSEQTAQSGTTATSEQNQKNETSAISTIESVMQLMSQLLNTNTNTNQTTDTKLSEQSTTKGSKSSMGASFSS